MNERRSLIAENDGSTGEVLTPAIAQRVLVNRAAVLKDYTLSNYLLVAQNPHAQVILDLCYSRDLRKFPVAIGSLRDGTGTVYLLFIHSLSAALSWSIKHMNRPVAKSLVGQACYRTDDKWLASLWEPIVLSVPNRDSNVDASTAAANAIPVWNSFSIFRCIMEYAVHTNGKGKRGTPGTSSVHLPPEFIYSGCRQTGHAEMR